MYTVLFQCVFKTKTFNPRKFSLQSARDELIFFFFFHCLCNGIILNIYSSKIRRTGIRSKENPFFFAVYIYIYISLNDLGAKERPIWSKSVPVCLCQTPEIRLD